MKTRLTGLVAAALLCVTAQAASISTSATLNGTATLNTSGGVNATGSGTMTNIGAVTFTATASLGATSISGPITITVTSGGTLNGTISLPTSILSGQSSNSSASVAITGGTGTYAGATGTLSGNGTGGFSGTAITFTFTGGGTINTSGGGTTNPIPTISAVLDAASYTNSIAQGSIFVVKGTSLSPSGFTQNNGFPLQTTLGNVKVTFAPTNGSASTDAYMVYLYNQGGVNQLACLLPSTVAVGNYNVTVTSNGQAGPPFSASVVKSKFGLITRDSTGNGLAVVQNFISATQVDIDAYTTQNYGGVSLSAAYPGQTLVAYGTGFGAASGADNTASAGFNFAANGHTVSAIVGNSTITPVYAGRTPGSAGLDQVNLVLPGNVQTGCAVPFQIVFDGITSPATYLSIAPGAGQPCVQSGFTTAQLSQFDQGLSVYGGGFNLSQFTESIPLPTGAINGKYDVLAGEFTQTSGFELTAINGSTNITTITQGSCSISTVTSSATTIAGGTSTNLDAGTISIAGPAGSGLSGNLTNTKNAYTFPLGLEGGSSGVPGLPSTNVTLVAGTYSLTGNGGADVGKFNTSITVGSPLTVTGGLPSSVTRSSGLTVNFSGGNPSDQVILIGSSSTLSGTTSTTTTFTCYTTAGTGSITAPAGILNQLPASTTGFLEIGSGALNTFTAPLTAGGTINAGFYASFGSANTSVAFR